MELFESFDEGHGFSVGTTQAEQAGQIDNGMLRVSFTLILLVTYLVFLAVNCAGPQQIECVHPGSPVIFAFLLHPDEPGFWVISPVAAFCSWTELETAAVC